MWCPRCYKLSLLLNLLHILSITYTKSIQVKPPQQAALGDTYHSDCQGLGTPRRLWLQVCTRLSSDSQVETREILLPNPSNKDLWAILY